MVSWSVVLVISLIISFMSKVLDSVGSLSYVSTLVAASELSMVVGDSAAFSTKQE